jgi:uncharacterized protein
LRAAPSAPYQEIVAMPIGLHAMSAPVFQRGFQAMSSWFDRAEQHAAQRKFDPSGFLAMKLAPDMLPLVRQVQIATDTTKGCMARLAGDEVPSWPDDEKSFDDLRARVRKAVDYVTSFDAARIDAGETREIVLPLRNRDPIRFVGVDYLRFWVLPNYYFHLTTTYALLRQGGVELGKVDFLGANR